MAGMETVEKVEPILLRAPEIAAAYRISLSKAYEPLASGRIKAIRIGRSVRARREDVENFARTGE
jgi:excisionase family DNA binding protein